MLSENMTNSSRRSVILTAGLLTLIAATSIDTAAVASERQSLDDAWWTGPILAAGAGTLPQGHFLIEPYVFDVVTRGRFDADGDRRSTDKVHSFGSLTYVLYGLTDKITVGVIPRFGFNDLPSGKDSSGLGFGDFTVQGQYRLTQFREGGRVPTLSLVLQETLPTGKYDQLGDRPSDGFGSGAYTTTVSLYSQYYFWLPNGRILRSRFNLSQSFSGDADVQDISVYGTPQGFRGRASPGNSFTVASAWEYSLTRNWVLALDLYYQYDESTRVAGSVDPGAAAQRADFQASSGASKRFGLAPAIEYNWSPRAGVIVGARWVAAGHNVDATVTPVAAINLVY